MNISRQVTQADLLSGLNLNYAYVALTSLWSYDYILCLPDAVTFLAESRWGFCTFLYLTCSHLPFAFLILNLLVVLQPDAPILICRTYNVINTYVGILTVACAECIFIIRAYAVWERERWTAVYAVISTIAYLVAIAICLQEYNFSVPEPCWIPGIAKYLDTGTSTRLCVAFGLLATAELQILSFLLYRTVKSRGGWGIDNRLMVSLLRHNLLYFGCGFAFSLSVILTAIFLPFPVVHVLAQFVYSHFRGVTRMHRDFWRSDRLNASCGISTDTSLSTWMTRTPHVAFTVCSEG
ncbi:uncharacterized protein BJ212DRAFT_984595 [Suillus subaureus]|uniref:DUF6533 domain-containing protein n=1 Tax=Suillus subaureus TaxID=48587 RepID=A0A9P7JGM6_9AGAM|nr:uncharacterized protein BJ212DRAFT_984595 [Suillus subaureus]KAG1821128.1 hypothetical protein BJ212DRAFT_984595 [Suillus subaureus]